LAAEEDKMPFVTSFERYAFKKGYEEGLRKSLWEGIDFCLDLKFGRARRKLMPMIRSINDVKLLRALLRRIPKSKTLEEFRSRLERQRPAENPR
jgi:hypothetical protein